MEHTFSQVLQDKNGIGTFYKSCLFMEHTFSQVLQDKNGIGTFYKSFAFECINKKAF